MRLRLSVHGSSPRWRGTPDRVSEPHCAGRFIPALAGNATSCRVVGTASPVHPRAGGERRLAGVGVAQPVGSSPRWRGTRCQPLACFASSRFIPALAGNAVMSPSRLLLCAVHPRAGGERILGPSTAAIIAGSSPRWRGTLSAVPQSSRVQRFIPALAGNAPRPKDARCPSPVHPRAGGERLGPQRYSRHNPGSSPRWRGTHGERADAKEDERFIPALAGNAVSILLPRRVASVHPRAGGERTVCAGTGYPPTGSSPRWRGTR